MSFTTGQMLRNRYLIIQPLNEGGFGLIYLALDITNRSLVAIKESNAQDHDVQNAILEEIKLLTRVHHEHLPQMYDYFQAHNQRFCIVMEYIPGQNLQQILKDVPRLTLLTALGWMRQVLEAIAVLHTHMPPIVHRDVKLSNIQIHNVTAKAYLLDFGIAKTGQHTLIAAFTSPFSPPEQYKIGATSPASDVYAVGVCLYMLLTGKTPPDAIDRAGQPLSAPRTLNPALPESIERVIIRALELDPQRRYPNGQVMLAALKAAMEDLDGDNVDHERAAAMVGHYRGLLARRRKIMMRDKRQIKFYQRLLLRRRERRKEALKQYRQIQAVYEAQLAEREQRIQELVAAVETREMQLAEREQRIQELVATVETHEAELADSQQQLQTLVATVARREMQLAEREQRIQELVAAVETREGQLAERQLQLQALAATVETREGQLAEREQRIQELAATVETREAQLAEKQQRIQELAATVETIERAHAANPLLIVWSQELFRWIGVALLGMGIAALTFQSQSSFASALQFTILIWGGYPVAWLCVTKVIGLVNGKYAFRFRSVEWTCLFLIYVLLITICSFSITYSMVNGANRESIAGFRVGVYCLVGLAIITGLLCDFLQEKQQSTRVLLEDR